ncbi:MAG: glycogen/starch/alpha-glucan phosphorylase [Anaerolineales bacterium]|jgi:starch phosphorylase
MDNIDFRCRIGRNVEEFKRTLEDNLYFTRGQSIQRASHYDVYMALSHTVRDHLIENWRKTVNARFAAVPKFVYYLSAEYLLGRQLSQNLLYTDTVALARDSLAEFGLDLDRYIDMDVEPGLGNGGLGRLAACFIDSLATMDIPCVGYGIRYEFGIFKQTFQNGWQVEQPDDWLSKGNPWEFPQPDEMVAVGFGGTTEQTTDEKGNYVVRWFPSQTVLGEPYNTMVPGYQTESVNVLRLWRARATNEFNYQHFDEGNYAQAVEEKVLTENITKVLYPNDDTPQGKELRLQQQYFFVACSLRDIIRRFLRQNDDWRLFPENAVIQLNDTHPVIAIPELMRILVDEEHIPWDLAWEITQRTFAFTNHTLLPEALEKWSVELFERLLPRHLEIIYEINFRFLREVRTHFHNEPERVTRMSIVEEYPFKQIRMAHLAAVGSFSINGVAELQSELLKERVMLDFYQLWPQKFNNKTNGVSPRRFMKIANPRLSDLISSKIGDDWVNHLEQLSGLEQFVDQRDFCQAWRNIKRQNKQDLVAYIREHHGIEVNPDSIFDVMVKRLHEYKRQLLKVLHIITLYNRIKDNLEIDIVPRTYIFGAKAAPGYRMAKLIIKLINSVAEVINNDLDVQNYMKVVFLENFNVSLAQKIYPAADISEQISMAGKEASGTGNMKFALNGALTTGTLDGANIEIREQVGEENFFLFGLTADQVFACKESGYNPADYYYANQQLGAAVRRIATGYFSNGNPTLFQPIIDSLMNHDEYLIFADYQSYIECQDRAEKVYRDQDAWTRMAILNTARCGFFSSDRTMQQYLDDIWKVDPVIIES